MAELLCFRLDTRHEEPARGWSAEEASRAADDADRVVQAMVDAARALGMSVTFTPVLDALRELSRELGQAADRVGAELPPMPGAPPSTLRARVYALALQGALVTNDTSAARVLIERIRGLLYAGAEEEEAADTGPNPARWRCPCGDAHEGSLVAWETLKKLQADGLAEHTKVTVISMTNPARQFLVPRAWITHHGLQCGKSGTVAELAARYGWEEVES